MMNCNIYCASDLFIQLQVDAHEKVNKAVEAVKQTKVFLEQLGKGQGAVDMAIKAGNLLSQVRTCCHDQR